MEPLMPKRGAIMRLIFRETLGVIPDLILLREKVANITDLIVRESALLRGSEDQLIETEKDLRELDLMLTVAEGMGESDAEGMRESDAEDMGESDAEDMGESDAEDVESHLMPTVAEGTGGSDQVPLTLVEDIRQLLVHAEDVVSAFVNERRRHTNWGCFKRTIFFFRDMIARHRFQDEIEKIRLKKNRIKLQGTSIGIGQIDASEDTQSAALWGPSGSHVEESNDIMGLELHYKVIKSRLMYTAGSGEKQSVISIVGKSGAGKTALAHKIYNDSEIKKHFTCRAWITLSPKFVPETLLRDISTQVQASLQVTDQRTRNFHELTKILSDFLSSKRYLVVLDDVWMTEDWDKLRMAFPKTEEGSGIIVTTRVRKVALHTNPKSPPYELQLSDEDGWMLLNSKIDVPAELEEVGRKIVRRCMGSPLMISTVGTRLSKTKATKEQWTSMLKDLKKGLARKDEGSDESPEVVAEKYLSQLIERKLIQVVKRKPDGRVKTCRMHDVLRDEWVAKAKAANFLPPQNRAQVLPRNACARSGRVFRPKLPESLGKLIYLRYLGLRWTYLENLPSSIDKLFNLQILDLKHTYVSTLPRSFWKMQQLRHLYLSESYRTRFVPPRGTGSLTDLQTLWGAFVDEESTLDNSLYRLTKLRKLALTCRLTRDQQKATASWISSLERLEWLRLISIDISVKPSDLYLELLSGLKNLSSIYLVGRLTKPVVVDKFPEELIELTLSSSGLTEDPMPKLEKLPNLKILQLLGDAFEGKFMVCSPGGFPLLQVLKLWKLKRLERLEVGKGSLPILKELEIRACTALQTIPEGLQHLEFLHKFKLKDMPEEFTRRVRKGQGEDWGIIAHKAKTTTELAVLRRTGS
ncbi:disease resistance protein RPH8A [Eucalyptus grandis]|uniref:disease resistance protein RPH8A n=1 Tax=Eucalyptus grandis TaxID=71139 RepID=UPI00192E87D0|nr:disease resistance protein RPH8A [Eucalyptus grandis]